MKALFYILTALAVIFITSCSPFAGGSPVSTNTDAIEVDVVASSGYLGLCGQGNTGGTNINFSYELNNFAVDANMQIVGKYKDLEPVTGVTGNDDFNQLRVNGFSVPSGGAFAIKWEFDGKACHPCSITDFQNSGGNANCQNFFNGAYAKYRALQTFLPSDARPSTITLTPKIASVACCN
jgi:hypothetical protein